LEGEKTLLEEEKKKKSLEEMSTKQLWKEWDKTVNELKKVLPEKPIWLSKA